MNDNQCVCCGAYVPEGRQVCPECERRTMQDQRYLENPMVSGYGFPVEKEPEEIRCCECGDTIEGDIYEDRQNEALCLSCLKRLHRKE